MSALTAPEPPRATTSRINDDQTTGEATSQRQGDPHARGRRLPEEDYSNKNTPTPTPQGDENGHRPLTARTTPSYRSYWCTTA
jgi:hypothetical protein